MPIRLSGINSGLDTDAIVKELVSAYSLKTEKYQKEQTKIEWKQDAWKSLNTKIYGLYTNVSNLRLSSAYNMKKTSVSDNTKATVTATSDAVTGTQKLSVLETAQASYITGGFLGEDVKSSTTLKELGYPGGDTSFKVKSADGKETTIEVTADTKISELITKFKDAGLNANFDVNNGRLFLSAKESGEDFDFDIVADSNDGKNVLAALGLSSVDEKKAALQNQANTYNDLKAQLEALSYDETYDYQADVDAYKNATARYDARVALDNISSAVTNRADQDGTYESFVEADFLTAVKDGKAEEYLKDCGLNEEEIAAQKENIKKIKDYDTQNGDLSASISDIETARDNLEAASVAAQKIIDIQNQINSYSDTVKGIADGSIQIDKVVDTQNTATKIVGQDAVISLNGVEYKSSSNSFSINGLTIEALGKTNGEITINTSVDTQGIYDKIKDFLTEYNNVINEITKLYNAEAATDYEPLTDEEKDAMSEEQIEKWEDKIKSSLLRRDNSLGTIMNAMVNSMAQTFEVNGEKLSLGNFGISTLGFLNAAENEQYAFHIDGDEDDENTSGKKDKLMVAIQENPDQIMEFMQKLTSNLYTAIDDKMKSTELSSAYKVYNDKELDKELTGIEELIEKWEDKIADEEEYYYNKFSQMEVALSKLQSQTNSLSGLLGQ